jgi:catechol 2,3-dioxygenase-like lactoylglutathione lyase family enzyme
MPLSAGDAPHCNGVHHVNIRVPADEIPALSRFYSEIVGLKVGTRPPFRSRGVWLYAGEDAVVHLSECRPGETLPPATKRKSGFNHVALDCSGFDAMVARLTAEDIAFHVTDVPLTGQRQIFISDPSGVGVELIYALEGTGPA